jgi:hypothetical protein
LIPEILIRKQLIDRLLSGGQFGHPLFSAV